MPLVTPERYASLQFDSSVVSRASLINDSQSITRAKGQAIYSANDSTIPT